METPAAEPSQTKDQLIASFIELTGQMIRLMHMRPPASFVNIELTVPQVRILTLLQARPLRMGELTAYSAVSLSSASAIIERLVEKGFVERIHPPDDRRVVICALTPAGRAEIDSFWQVSNADMEELARMMTDDELRDVVRVTRIMISAGERRVAALGEGDKGADKSAVMGSDKGNGDAG